MPGYIQFPTNPVKNIPSTIIPTPKPFSMQSIFSNNSQVVYKPGSLAPGGVGTVKNSSMKSKKT
jgi:hypothetical protein